MSKNATCASKDSAETVRKWTSSDEGRKAIKEAVRKARESSEQLQASRRVDPADLRRPFTV